MSDIYVLIGDDGTPFGASTTLEGIHQVFLEEYIDDTFELFSGPEVNGDYVEWMIKFSDPRFKHLTSVPVTALKTQLR